MAVYRRSHRTRTLVLVLVLVAVTLVTLDARSGGSGVLGRLRANVHDGMSPVQRVTHDALQPIGDFLSGAAGYGSLRAENERLRRQVSALEAQGISAAAAQAEAAQVIAGAHLNFVGAIPTRAARIIDQGGSNFENSVTIDKGSDDGLVVGQPVVAAGAPGGTGGLVGTVSRVGRRIATVDLLTDPSFVVGVRLDQVNTGTAEGLGAGVALRVSVISTAEKPPTPARRQAVVTSGLPMERYPPGIPVGTIASVTTARGSLEPSLTLTPLVDLSHLDIVEVEIWSPQTPPSP